MTASREGRVNHGERPNGVLERNLIGSILMDGSQIPKVLGLGLHPKHFHDRAIGLAFRHATDLYQSQGVTDVSLVTNSIAKAGDLDDIGADFLYECATSVPASSHAPHYAREIIKHWAHRETIRTLEESVERLTNDDELSDVVLRTQSQLETVKREAAAAGRFQFVDAATYLDKQAPKPVPIFRGFLDHGDKLFTFAESKIGKSFHAQQGCLCLAAGRPFLGLEPDGPKRTLYVNYEIQAHHCWKRFHTIAGELGITPADIGDRLQILNVRGSPPPLTILNQPFDVIVLDPWYKLLAALGRDENNPKDVGLTLSEIDTATRHTAPAIWIIHHTPKGFSGDRSLLDRGAGSGKLGRDLDACFSLGRHRDEQGAVVIEKASRNYKNPHPIVVQWDGCFRVRDDLDPVVETSRSAAKKGNPSIESIAKAVIPTIEGPERTEDVKERIRKQFGVGKNKTDDVIRAIGNRNDFARWKSKTCPSFGMIGPAEFKP